MGNRLKGQSSPYLLQHAHNPVDWFPWCEEAFTKAEREDKPIFLSIGYSTCHWCHVMAHESFEDEETAGILNRYFVSIKVDREERPDIDSVYMSVCQAFTGSGGWPMSIFMTPGQRPFFAGTYFPPSARYGMAGFKELLLAVADRWEHGKERLLESADGILAILNKESSHANGTIGRHLPKQAAALFRQSFDAKNGGFGSTPKFPVPHNLIFLMLYAQINQDKDAFQMAAITLDKMRRGGIFDHIGYGFSRYSTDERYLVPHFEKMLYDNALLILAYAAAYKASGNPDFLDTAEQAAEYIFREMTGENGEFYAAQDADSEGGEGKYYVWRQDEVYQLLGEEKGRRFCRHFGITPQGNFEGSNIPNVLHGDKIADGFGQEKKILYEYRKNRAKLHLDDKILTSWNALMICAMAMLYRVTGKECYFLAARDAQQFIENRLTDGSLLYVSCRDGARSVKGFLDDYAYETAALLCLYEVSGNSSYLKQAESFCGEARKQFADENGGYFLYGTQNSQLIAKPKECYDGALPSGNSVMAYCLVRLAQLTGKEDYQREADRQLAFLSAEAAQYPAGHSMFLISLLYADSPPWKITVVLSGEDDASQLWPRLPLYADIQILRQETAEYRLLHGRTAYYVCKNHTCLPPTNEMPMTAHL